MAEATSTRRPLIPARDLPPLSSAAVEICRRAAKEDLSPAELATVISQDPALAVKVLRIANSPFYGLRTQVKTLQHAIVVLGQVSVISLCAAMSAIGTLKVSGMVAHPRYGYDSLRQHSVLAAILSRWLAQQLGSSQVPAADAFMAGLLHDIGELAIAVYHSSHLGALKEFEDRNPEHAQVASEHEIFGFDHQAVGAEVLTLWHLPSLYIHVASHHHDPRYPIDGDHGLMVAVIQTGDALAEILHPLLIQRAPREDGTAPSLAEDVRAAISRVPQVTPVVREKLEHDLNRLLEECTTMIEYSRAS